MAKTLGIDVADMPVPKIVMSSDPDSGISPEKLKGMAGGFSSTEGTIYIKDEQGSKLATDCYEVLNTILHENTHNYQFKLVQMLEAGALKKDQEPGKSLYDQAVLFQLNMGPGPGYLGGEPGYKKQPTEEHAHKAGDDAEEFFKELDLKPAKDSAQNLIAAMSDWKSKNPNYPDKFYINGWVNSLNTVIRVQKDADKIDAEVNKWRNCSTTWCKPPRSS